MVALGGDSLKLNKVLLASHYYCSNIDEVEKNKAFKICQIIIWRAQVILPELEEWDNVVLDYEKLFFDVEFELEYYLEDAGNFATIDDVKNVCVKLKEIYDDLYSKYTDEIIATWIVPKDDMHNHNTDYQKLVTIYKEEMKLPTYTVINKYYTDDNSDNEISSGDSCVASITMYNNLPFYEDFTYRPTLTWEYPDASGEVYTRKSVIINNKEKKIGNFDQVDVKFNDGNIEITCEYLKPKCTYRIKNVFYADNDGVAGYDPSKDDKVAEKYVYGNENGGIPYDTYVTYKVSNTWQWPEDDANGEVYEYRAATFNGKPAFKNEFSFSASVDGSVDIVCYYVKKEKKIEINVKHVYFDSTGKKTLGDEVENTSNRILLKDEWKEFYYETTIEIIPENLKNDITITKYSKSIHVRVKKGSKIDKINIKITYKSKKINMNYIILNENGITKKESVDGEEIGLNEYKEYKLKTDTIKLTKEIDNIKAQYLGGELINNKGNLIDWDWRITRFGTEKTDSSGKIPSYIKFQCKNYENESKASKFIENTNTVYTYNIYYSVRKLYRYPVYMQNNTTKHFGESHIYKRREVSAKNCYQSIYGREFFSKEIPINKLADTYYTKTEDGYQKYIFNKYYKTGVEKIAKTEINTKLGTLRTIMNHVGEPEEWPTTGKLKIKSLSSEDPNDYSFKYTDINIAYLYYEVEQPVRVYVRHMLVNADGTYTVSTNENLSFLRNTNEKYHDSELGGNRIIENGYNQRKYHGNAKNFIDSTDGITYKDSSISERFTIDKKDKLYLDKSRTLLYDGIQYKYLGYKKSDTMKKANAAGVTKINKSIEISGNDAGDKVFVDFYYEEEAYSTITPTGPGPQPPSDPDPTQDPDDPDDPEKNISPLAKKAEAILKFRSENKSGLKLEDNTGDIAYVPASEYIRPYFQTAMYVPHTLTYSLTIDNKGNFGYNLENLKTYMLEESGHEVTSKEIVGEKKFNVIDKGNVNATNLPPDNGFNADVYSNSKLGIYATEIPVGEKTTIRNFNDNNNNNKQVSSDKYNGIRKGDGTVRYKLVSKYGRDDTGNGTLVDINVIESMDVNVYTPMKIEKPVIKTTGSMVNHSNTNTKNNIIQYDAEFELKPQIDLDYKGDYDKNNLPKIDKYLKGYYVIFDFDILKSGDVTPTPAKQPIWLPYDPNKEVSIKAKPVSTNGDTSIKQLQEKITTIAVTINASEKLCDATFMNGNYDRLLNNFKKYYSSIIGNSETKKVSSKVNNKYNIDNGYESEFYSDDNKIKMYADSYYFVKKVSSTFSIARLYDFKITDCYDVDFKNVFRKKSDDTSSNVNEITGVCFYSGTKKLYVYEGNNVLWKRAENTILPLGPYKHTQYDYVKAPKLGYRISFDLKTYGYYNHEENGESRREIKITPSYYYISKDGSTFNDKIKLYYKNASGKYVIFNDNNNNNNNNNNNSNYNISFKPNDGYRHLTNSKDTDSTDRLSTKLVNIGVSNSFTLSPESMMSTSENKFIQTWYGEYKVPNSTIVVDAENPNLNKPLTDGYLGVKFKIECIDSIKNNGKYDPEVTVLYDQNDQNASNVNTTQWDYEGYMGSVAGTEFSGSLQLEKGKWTIDKDRYKNIKGTVVLYDLDERAANDFD